MPLIRAWLVVNLAQAARWPASEGENVLEGTFFYHKQSEATNAQLFKGLGCYCKEVASVSECPFHKQLPGGQWDLSESSFFRFFHEDAEEKPLCCKLASTSIFDVKGWSYKRHENMKLCTYDVRPLPEDVCCRLKNYHEDIGLRVRYVTKYAGQRRTYDKKQEIVTSYFISPPYFALKDILDGQDYNGSAVGAAQVQAFVTERVRLAWRDDYERHLHCQRDYDVLLQDKGQCTLRSKAAKECCCHEASLDEAERCLPVAGIVDGVVVNGTYSEVDRSTSMGVFKKGAIQWDVGSSFNKAVPPAVAPDPAIDLATNFEWEAVLGEWECTATKSVAVIGVKMKPSSLLQNQPRPGGGAQAVLRMQQQRRQRRAREEQARKRRERQKKEREEAEKRRARQRREREEAEKRRARQRREREEAEKPEREQREEEERRWVYFQDYREECISRKYSSRCPSGHWLFKKQIPSGECRKEPNDANHDELKLVELGPLRFGCPMNYKKNPSKSPHDDNISDKCRCNQYDCREFRYGYR